MPPPLCNTDEGERRMSIDRIHLRKLLEYFGLTSERRMAAVKADARAEIRKAGGVPSPGGDFHSCFWADAKAFAAGAGDLTDMTEARIIDSKLRSRLYPLLAKGYLTWWNEKRRWINEPIQVIPQGVKAPYSFQEIGGTVKVENMLALSIGGSRTRLIYPYFSEKPILDESIARLGLWLMSQALSEHSIDDMRILDVLRGQTFSVDRHPLQGNEGVIFVERYAKMLTDWKKFLRDFG